MPRGLGAALRAGFGVLETAAVFAWLGNAPGLVSNAPRPGRSGDGADAGAALLWGEEPGEEGAGGFGFADVGADPGDIAARGDDFASGGEGRGSPAFAPGAVAFGATAGAASVAAFGAPPTSVIGRGAFGTIDRGSVYPPGETLSGAGGTSLSGMTKPHFLHFIRTDRPATFSSAIWYFALQLGQRNFIR